MSALISKLFDDHILNKQLRFRYAILNGCPNEIIIYTKIGMDQSVPHSRHLSPGDFWMMSFNFIGNISCCLADNLEFSYNSAGRFIIRLKTFKLHTFNKTLDAFHCLQNIIEVQLEISHRFTTSFNTVSFISFLSALTGTTSTFCPSLSSRNKPSPTRSKRSASSSKSASTSISLVVFCSPLTTEPKTPISLTLYFVLISACSPFSVFNISSLFFMDRLNYR